MAEKKVREKARSTCTVCGYPSFTDVCNFCRLLGKFGIEHAVSFEQYGAR